MIVMALMASQNLLRSQGLSPIGHSLGQQSTTTGCNSHKQLRQLRRWIPRRCWAERLGS